MSDEEETHFGDAPEEVSSKKRVSTFRHVIQSKKNRGRDPRFLEEAGEFSSHHFDKNYGFIDQIQKSEIGAINQQMKQRDLDDEERARLEKAKTILRDRLADKERKSQIRKIKSEQMKQEARLVEKGKKPYYVKKSVIKQTLQEKQFEQLDAKGQLEKWMAKKSKRKASKQRKFIPRRRVQDE